MRDDLAGRLRWFLQNLDWLLEDYQLEEKKTKIDLYFDTREVQTTILGLQYFYYAGYFVVDEAFRSPEGRPLRDRILALCLAFDGRLGPIKMLPPHQAELLAGLNKNFDTYINLPEKQMARQFLEAVKSTGLIKGDVPSREDAGDRERLQDVRRSVGSAINFYKALLLTRGIAWQERLARMRKARTLELEPQEINFDRVIASPNFEKLYQALETERMDKSGNFADAVALTILAEQVEVANDGGPVPRFYVTSERSGERPLFLRVIETAKMHDAFVYAGPGANRSDVFRLSDYFVFKTTFQFRASTVADAQPEPGKPDDLQTLRNRIAGILEPNTPVTPEQVDAIVFKGKSLMQVINDINTFSFFTNVWLSTSTADEEIVLEDLQKAASELKSAGLTKEVREELEDARAILEKGSSEFFFVRHLWEQIDLATKKLRTHLRERLPEAIDYFRYFGLLRFSFPEDAHKKINDVLEALLKGTDNSTHSNLIAACYMAHITPTEKYVDDLSAAASVLWVTEKYDELAFLLSKVRPLPHYSLAIIYAASIFETQQQEWRGIKIMRRLYDNYSKAHNVKRKANLAVGLAYLNYHLWRRRGFGPTWEAAKSGQRKKAGGEELIQQAIQLASEAYELIGDWDMKKKVYALNQYLFYLVMGGGDNLISEMHEAAIELLRYKGQGAKEWWQHRFDDTLAWYYYRLACSVNDEEHWKRHIDRAMEYAQDAAVEAPSARDTRAFLDRLQAIDDLGFQKAV